MSSENDTKASLVPVQRAALSRTGAASLATRGLRDLLEAESADAWCERGYELWHQGKSKWKDAVACCRRGLEVNPNHPGLQFLMGFAYNIGGGGVARDDAEAVRWYRKAAEQGHARAQWNLGDMYEHGGLGVARDDAEAVRWYRKAENSEKRKP